MSDLDRVTTADGRVLTDAEAAALAGIVKRCSWPSMHWGVEDVHRDAWPHLAIAAVAAAAPLIEAQVREQRAVEIKGRQIVCPVHHMPDCSPLLNGCSLPNHLDEQREIDAAIARGEVVTAPRDRYAQCDETCTTDCGACKGQGRPAPVAPEPPEATS